MVESKISHTPVPNKILITGASGFIGSVLANKLQTKGHKIYGVSRQERNNAQGMSWHRGDLTDFEFVQSLIEEVQPDYIYHLASHVLGSREFRHVMSTFQNNFVTAFNLLHVVHRYPCKRVILGGSFEEYDNSQKTIIPSSPYAAAKFAASNYARMFHRLYNTPVSLASIFMVYGPGQIDLTKLTPYVILKTLAGEPPEITSGVRLIDWIYVDDVAEALIHMMNAPGIDGQSIDIGSGKVLSVHDFVISIMNLIKPSLSPKFGAVPDRPMEQEKIADIDATYKALGWKASTDLNTGLRNTIRYYSNHRNFPD